MKPIGNARRLRREQTSEEKQLWRALRDRRFAGFKFRRQHPVGNYLLDFYCAAARVSVELDGSGHGWETQTTHDQIRKQFLASHDIEELRFWNSEWKRNREGVLLKIWHTLQSRSGCVKFRTQEDNHRFVPPATGQFISKPHSPNR